MRQMLVKPEGCRATVAPVDPEIVVSDVGVVFVVVAAVNAVVGVVVVVVVVGQYCGGSGFDWVLWWGVVVGCCVGCCGGGGGQWVWRWCC